MANDRPYLTAIVEALCDDAEIRKVAPRALPLPSRDAVNRIVDSLRSILFPGYFGISELSHDSVRFHIGAALDRVLRSLEEQVQRGLMMGSDSATVDIPPHVPQVVRQFTQQLPEIQRRVHGDVEAAYEGDPALTNTAEAIFCYPGLHAITSYRIAHELHTLGVPLLPRMITEYAHGSTGIDIHPGAQIGERFFIDHGTGVVIGETSIIGNSVRIYQGVTLGAKSFPLDAQGRPIKGIPRHPIVEDEVIVYSGATILGRVTLGRASVIGGNVWLTRSVPPGSRITQAQATHDAYEKGAGI